MFDREQAANDKGNYIFKSFIFVCSVSFISFIKLIYYMRLHAWHVWSATDCYDSVLVSA